MKIVQASVQIESPIDADWILNHIEAAGRTCYKSMSKGDPRSFARMVLKRGHESVIEHASITVRFIVDRGVSHEIVRHRLASYSQESTRYCNYSQDRFGNEITVISIARHMTPGQYAVWCEAMRAAERYYMRLLELGVTPEIARSVAPNSTKTEVVMTANIREWRHFFKLRTAETAHPQMREVARPLLAEFRKCVPVLFDDVGVVECCLEREREVK